MKKRMMNFVVGGLILYVSFLPMVKAFTFTVRALGNFDKYWLATLINLLGAPAGIVSSAVIAVLLMALVIFIATATFALCVFPFYNAIAVKEFSFPWRYVETGEREVTLAAGTRTIKTGNWVWWPDILFFRIGAKLR